MKEEAVKELFYRLWALWKKESLQLWRNPILLLIFLLGVTLQLVIFGYSVNSKIRNISLLYFDQDQTTLSRKLIRSLEVQKYFKLLSPALHEEEIQQALQTGRAQIGVWIPAGFSKKLLSHQGISAKIYLDGTETNTILLAKGYLLRIFENFFKENLLEKASPALKKLPEIQANMTFLYNPRLQDPLFFIPGYIGLVVGLLVTGLTTISFARETESGTLTSIQMSPVRYFEFFLGKTGPIFLVASLNTFLGFLVGSLCFHIPLHGSLSLLIISSLFFILYSVALGFLIARFSHSQFQAALTCTMVMVPSLFLSGGMGQTEIWWPTLLRYLSWANPLQYYVRLTRATSVLGQGWAENWHSFTVLVMATVLLVGLSLWQTKRFFAETAVN